MKLLTTKQLVEIGRVYCFEFEDDVEDGNNKDKIYPQKQSVRPKLEEHKAKMNYACISQYELKPIVDKLIKGAKLLPPEIKLFKSRIALNKDGQHVTYKLSKDSNKNRKQLEILISRAIEILDVNGDLNWIDISNVKNFRGLFLHSSFVGNLSYWKIPYGADCSYMFAFSDFDNVNYLPKIANNLGCINLIDEIEEQRYGVNTTGIFHRCKGEQKFYQKIEEERTNPQINH